MAFYQEFRYCQVPFTLKVGDGICDHYGMYNTAACNYDGGDCKDFNKDYPNCEANFTQLIGDGHCDNHGFFNTEACGFDGGDCIAFNKIYPECKAENGTHVSDGYCDSGTYNTEACGFDGGDCEEFNDMYPGCKAEWPLGPPERENKAGVGNGWCDVTETENREFLSEECQNDGGDCNFENSVDVPTEYPNCTVIYTYYIGDGWCDGGIYNTPECGFDGGDCDWFNADFPNCTVEDPWRLGDGVCFGRGRGYNTPECGFDDGDCDDINAQYPDCNVDSPSWLNDQACDGGIYNNEACGYDGGDCIGVNLTVADYPYCVAVRLPSFVGDGKCDGGIYNSPECGFDGGDCDEYNDKYPDCNATNPHELGDGVCNDELAKEECGYDGGDCENIMLFMYGKAVPVSDYRSDTRIFSTIQSSMSALSLLASAVILCIIYRSHVQLSSTIHRLLLGLCLSDLLSSFAQSFSTLPAPKEFSEIIWNASGSVASCEAQGFFIFVGSIAAPLYNCSLCFYYLAILKFGKKDEFIQKELEPYLHGVPVLVSLVGAFVILAKKAFNPNMTYCYIGPDPTCGDDECDRMADTRVFFYIFSAAPYIILPCVIVGSMASIYQVVLAQEKRSAQFDWKSKLKARTATKKSAQDNSVQNLRARTKAKANGAHEEAKAEAPTEPKKTFLKRLFERLTKSKTGEVKPKRKKNKQSRVVLNTALSYAFAFLFSYMFPMIISIRTLLGLGSGMTLSILARIFFPLQGFFNFCVFMYPYMRTAKAKGKNINWCTAFVRALKSRGPKKKVSRRLTSRKKGKTGLLASIKEPIKALKKTLCCLCSRKQDMETVSNVNTATNSSLLQKSSKFVNPPKPIANGGVSSNQLSASK